MKLLIASIVLSLFVLASAQTPTPITCGARKCSRIRFQNGKGIGRRLVGRTVRFQCNRGFILQGPSSIQCECVNDLPMWSDSFPRCVREGEFTVSRFSTTTYTMSMLLM